MNENHVPDWKLHRYLQGELPAEELEAIAALERSDGELRGRLAALRASYAEIKAKYPPAWMARKVQLLASAGKSENAGAHASARGASRRPGRGGLPLWGIPVLACIALLFALPMYMFKPNTVNNADADIYEERVKGDTAEAPVLQVWRKAEDRPEKLAPEATVQTGDIIQLWYIVPQQCYGALMSVDGRGVLTVHLHGSDGTAVQLTPGRPVSLRTSYQLDDAPQYEAFYLITSSERFDLEPVKTALLNAKHPIDDVRNLSLPKKRVTAFTLRK